MGLFNNKKKQAEGRTRVSVSQVQYVRIMLDILKYMILGNSSKEKRKKLVKEFLRKNSLTMEALL
jgi:hypothetical protein